MLKALKSVIYDEEGATMTEYILLVVLIAIALIAAVTVFRGKLMKKFEDAGTDLEKAK